MSQEVERGEWQPMTDDEAEKWAWECFAEAYPHEAAEMDFPRFLAFSQTKNPALTEQVVRDILARTAEAGDD